jgi:hypothetical protein
MIFAFLCVVRCHLFVVVGGGGGVVVNIFIIIVVVVDDDVFFLVLWLVIGVVVVGWGLARICYYILSDHEKESKTSPSER